MPLRGPSLAYINSGLLSDKHLLSAPNDSIPTLSGGLLHPHRLEINAIE